MLKAKRSNNKAAVSAALFSKHSLLLLCFLASTLFFTTLTYRHSLPTLPCKKQPLIFYANQCNDDLKNVYLQALQKAKSSLFLIIYGLTDIDIIKALQSKIQEGVVVRIFFDPGGSKGIEQHFPPSIAFPTKSIGLMHKKILVIDKKQILLGSANLTETSLRLHDNLLIGCYHKGLAYFLESSLENSYSFQVAHQQIELFSLPEPEQKALSQVLKELAKAEKSIKICMFTFTHEKLYQALIDARSRGVSVDIAIDYYSARGASKNIIKNLYNEGITPYIGPAGKLLHHKWCLIDDTTLILGSTNWTGSAFKKNDDVLILLPSLSPKQTSFMQKIWKATQKSSKPYKID